LRFKLERFRFSLIKRKPKQEIFQILLKEKNGGRKKLKKCIEKFSVLVCRSGAEANGNALHYYSGFSLKKGSDLVQDAEPIFFQKIRELFSRVFMLE